MKDKIDIGASVSLLFMVGFFVVVVFLTLAAGFITDGTLNIGLLASVLSPTFFRAMAVSGIVVFIIVALVI